MSARREPSDAYRATRAVARRKIVQAANRRAASLGRPARYSARHLQLCVGTCRRLGLVDASVLVDAEFNARASR